MKKLSLIFLSMALTFSAISQTTNYNGKAKTFVDRFWKYAEDLKHVEGSTPEEKIKKSKIIADNAMRQIAYIKQKDPSFDVAPLEEIIVPHLEASKSMIQKKIDQAKASSRNNDKQGDGLASLFMATTTTEIRSTGNFEEDLKTHITQIEAYNQKLERILAEGTDGAEEYQNFIRNAIPAAKEEIQKQLNEVQADNPVHVKYAYRSLVGLKTYWNAVQKIFPDIPEAASVYNMVNDGLTGLGSIDEVVAKANKKKQERLKNTFMPKALLSNISIENEFKEAFENDGWGETVVKVHLQSREWSIIRNDLTGAILYRIYSAAVVAKQKSGNCVLYSYSIKQQYTGGGYSNVSHRHSHGVLASEFLCENAR